MTAFDKLYEPETQIEYNTEQSAKILTPDSLLAFSYHLFRIHLQHTKTNVYISRAVKIDDSATLVEKNH